MQAQTRLAKLYPEYEITRMPEAVLPGCAPLVANAAVYGDAFQWHIDMDPALAPPSPWTAAHGTYPNRGAGAAPFRRPRVSPSLPSGSDVNVDGADSAGERTRARAALVGSQQQLPEKCGP